MPTAPAGPSPRPIVLLGFGAVARALSRRLPAGRDGPVRAVLDSRELLRLPEEGVLAQAIRRRERSGRLGGRPRRPDDLETLLADLPAPGVLVALTGSSEDGSAGRPAFRAAFRAGWDVVTADKRPIARHLPELRAEAARAGRALRFGATVGGAVPVLETLAGPLAGAGVERIEGIVSGSVQFLLGALAAGVPAAEARREAVRRGLTERDPVRDLDGSDAAVKAAILHAVAFGAPLNPDRIDRITVDPAVEARARAAGRIGRRLVAVTRVVPGAAASELREIPRGSRWDLPGASNAFCVSTRFAGVHWLAGPGAGPEATASGLLGDLVGLVADRRPPRRRPAVVVGLHGEAARLRRGEGPAVGA